MRFAGMGVELAGAFLVGALLGHAVDRFLLTAERPWGMLVGGLLGFTAGMARLIQLARAYYR
jgi:F0F1-type ATP synthase assembly protein I